MYNQIWKISVPKFSNIHGRVTVIVTYVPTFQRNVLLTSISIFFFFEVVGVGVVQYAYSCHCELPLCLVKRNPTKTFVEWRYNSIVQCRYNTINCTVQV